MDTPLSNALTLALEREYSQLTVTKYDSRGPIGYLDVAAGIKCMSDLPRDANVKDCYTKFDRRKRVGYQVITPQTELVDLVEFLKTYPFAVVTDPDRKFTLGIATMQDVEGFMTRRA